LNVKRALIIYVVLCLIISPFFFIRTNKVIDKVKYVKGYDVFERTFALNETFSYSYNFSFELQLHIDNPEFVEILPEFEFYYNDIDASGAKGYFMHDYNMYFNGEKIYSENVRGYNFAGLEGSGFPREYGREVWFSVGEDNVISVVGVLMVVVTEPKNSSFLEVRLGPIVVEERFYKLISYLGSNPLDYFLYLHLLFVAFLIEYALTKSLQLIRD